MKDNSTYIQSIINSSLYWVNGTSSIDSLEELSVISNHYGLNMPSYLSHFLYSESPNKFVATGAWKNISKYLCRLSKTIERKTNGKLPDSSRKDSN